MRHTSLPIPGPDPRPNPEPEPEPEPTPEQVRGKPHVDFTKVEAIVPCLVRLLGIDDGEVRAAYISPTSPLHLPYISPIPPLYLPCISVPRGARRRVLGLLVP